MLLNPAHHIIEALVSYYKNINVVGTSASGKSTFSKELAAKLNVQYIEMDELFWKPNWEESNNSEFLPKVEAAISNDGWVLDGNYSRTSPLKWAKVNTIVWIDYSLSRTVFQAFKRAIKRILSKKEIWPNTGNVESFRKTFLSRKSIILWTLQNYHSNRKKYVEIMTSDKYSHIDFVRLNSPKQAKEYIDKSIL